MKLKINSLTIAATILVSFSTNTTRAADYGYLYPPLLPNEQSVNDLPYAIPCAEAKNQHGASFYRCTWFVLPRNITQWDSQQQRNVTFSNHVSGRCIRGTCRASNGSGVYGSYSRDFPFSVSIYYYIHESTDGYPIAYRIDGGPAKNENTVSYAQAKGILNNFLLDHGVDADSVKQSMSAYDLDIATVDSDAEKDLEYTDSKPLTKPTKTIEIKEAWCNPRADDECTVNGQKVSIADLNQYLPQVYELEILNAGGYCEYPICYDQNDKPVGLR
ncbi:hypothetical protein [Pseudomonas sp. PA15(2017)]|uniref:hypothetical protein n=1 Tax=Pseudomonas sp. PA15(2017) TaxID=1932111 RepID=UPI002114A0EB|nr:hypothetical protein [Pseudomonas sp. PA15(2017)]